MRATGLKRWLPLGVALLAALLLRLALWGRLPRQGFISDEGEYLAAAIWLAQGRGFTWHDGWLWTRAPLYPLFLATHLRLFGPWLTPIYITQTLLSLAQTALVFALAIYAVPPALNRRFWSVPALAALLTALYFPLAVYAQVLLSETLFITLLLSALLALAAWRARRQQAAGSKQQAESSEDSSLVIRHSSFVTQPALSLSKGHSSLVLLVLAGALLGLATLTRGLALGFVPLAAGWVWVNTEGRRQKAEGRRQNQAARLSSKVSLLQKHRLLPACLFLFAFCLVLLPWSLYASRLYGGTVVVDTTGAFNLLLGARTAADGGRQDAPTRNFVRAMLDGQLTDQEWSDYRARTCLLRQGDQRLLRALDQPIAMKQAQRQQLMTAEALCLIRAQPSAFAQKSAAELVDLFRINYSGDERFSDGFTTGRLSPAYALGLLLLDDTLYLLALPLAMLGWALARKAECRMQNVGTAGENVRTAGKNEGTTGRNARTAGENAGTAGENAGTAGRTADCFLPSAFSSLVGLWWAYNLLTAPLLFAINRFRVPLMPLAFIYAAWALAALPAGEWRALGRRRLAHVTLALLLFMIAAQSVLGPYPGSLASTVLALRARPQYHRTEALQGALADGNAAGAAQALAGGEIAAPVYPLASALLAGLEGRPSDGLALLPPATALVSDTLWKAQPASVWGPAWRAQASVVRGDLLRRQGDLAGARAAFTPGFVDDYNPVEWAWQWLHPPPLPDGRIDLGGNLDLGYIQGFYLGQGDPAAGGTFRWSGPLARLRFPGQGNDAQQQLCLRADGRGWLDDLPMPHFSLRLGEQPFATLELQRDIQVYCATLPPSPAGADVIVTLHSPTFAPPAADLLAQQGPQVGQLRQLGLRLDWAELSER